MPFLSHLDFATTAITFGCISFAASSFGVKLGKVASRQNTLGFKYISNFTTYSDKLYDAIVKENASSTNTPSWAKNKDQLKNWCKNYETSTRYWKDASQYCLLKNNVRHQLIVNGVTLNETTTNQCTDEILNAYADNGKSLAYLLGKQRCATKST